MSLSSPILTSSYKLVLPMPSAVQASGLDRQNDPPTKQAAKANRSFFTHAKPIQHTQSGKIKSATDFRVFPRFKRLAPRERLMPVFASELSQRVNEQVAHRSVRKIS